MCESIVVKKKFWVCIGSFWYDEYEVTYKSIRRIKSGLYQFEAINVVKLNDKPFGGGGCVHIIYRTPKVGDKVTLRHHTLKWAIKNFNWGGRQIRWFNVYQPGKDEDYIQLYPSELYPITRKPNGELVYPKKYESKH